MKLLLFGAMASLLLPDVSTAQTRSSNARRVETYQSVAIDAAGGLVITTSDRKTILVPRETDQSSFSEPIVSSARTAVGAQAEFPNCCTSYDIPLQLVIYANGKVHRFTGIGLPIFHWHFADGGTRVAFGQEPVHFGHLGEKTVVKRRGLLVRELTDLFDYLARSHTRTLSVPAREASRNAGI